MVIFLTLNIERGLYMKATGVVRRIDDLGRIVIPKEIRRNLKINEGDSVEIFVDNSGIILKKYSLLSDMVEMAIKLVDIVYKIYSKSIIITDKERVIASSKDLTQEYQNHELTSSIKNRIESRCEYFEQDSSILIMDGKSISSYFLIPILVNSDSLGSVILIDDDINEDSKTLIQFITSILVKNIEG